MEEKRRDIDKIIKELRLKVKEEILWWVDIINDDILEDTKAYEIEQILGIKLNGFDSIYIHIYKYVVEQVLKFDYLEKEGK